MDNPKKELTRRALLKDGLRGLCLLSAGGVAGHVLGNSETQQYRWQLDPQKCVSCGNCAVNCVLEESAVKCYQMYAMCGYCKLCTGFFDAAPSALHTGAENQLCPTGAIIRTFIEDPYYEYKIDQKLCIGCGKCVKWCKALGNGSLFLQVQHDRCLNCNNCSIAAACPSKAFTRVPADRPYLLKGTNHSA